MKIIFLTATFGIMLATTCHQQKQNTMSPFFNADSIEAVKQDTSSKSSEPILSASPKTKGKVSHEFAGNGCLVIIKVKAENEEAPLVLIPRNQLPKEFDKEGLEISFNYHPLKMQTPAGCGKGIPAEITDVSLK